jgi:hypothetical protein
MSYHVITISRSLFCRLLAHAPESLQREANEKARRAIPALCFTECDIRQKLAQEEGWDDLSEDEQREAIEMLFDRGEYDHAGIEANQAIAEAAANYVADILLEKEQREAGGDMTW